MNEDLSKVVNSDMVKQMVRQRFHMGYSNSDQRMMDDIVKNITSATMVDE